MPETVWMQKNKSNYTPSRCEMLGVCQCEKDNVKCNIKIMAIVNRKDNRKKYRMGVRVL
jgi:hypothetical protein